MRTYLHQIMLIMVSSLLAIAECSQDGTDADHDGWSIADGDCDDTDSSVHPGAAEACEGVDNDCDGLTDEPRRTYRDADGDGYGSDAHVVLQCVPPTGYVEQGGDCDDGSSASAPGLTEVCDARDNDCDGAADEDFSSFYFRDEDGDGFGVESSVRCQPTAGYVSARGDCDDQRVDVHPGARDTAGDGIDSDCGGGDGAQAHVGFQASVGTELQGAIDASSSGDTLWVGPGTWPVLELHFEGKEIAFRSTHLAQETVLDAGARGRVMRVDAGEGPELLLDGFTFTGGLVSGENGGALLVSGASPTLNRCRFLNNQASGVPDLSNLAGNGGAVYLEDSDAEILLTEFDENRVIQKVFQDCSGSDGCTYYQAGGNGGGMMALRGIPRFSHLTFRNNVAKWEGEPYVHAHEGGGLYLEDVTSSVRDSVWIGNQAGRGGGAYIQGGSVTLQNLRFENNVAQDTDDNTFGPALYAYGGVYDITHIVATRNTNHTIGVSRSAINVGGTVRIQDSEATGNETGGIALSGDVSSTRLLISNNHGVGLSAGGTLSFQHLTVVNNLSASRGGVVLAECTAHFVNSLITHNYGYNLYNDPMDPCEISFESTSLYAPTGPNQNLTEQGVPVTWLEVDPQYVALTNDLDAANDDYHLHPTSTLRDAGVPSTWDDDGSRAEVGFYGGVGADSSYYRDEVGNGMYDGWEMLHGLDPDTSRAGDDPDLDGLANLDEFELRTHPEAPDTDGDGISDQLEVASHSDPLDWYLRPVGSPGTDEEGYAPAHFPGDFPTLAAAVNAIRSRGTVLLAPGTHAATLTLVAKELALAGTGAREETVLVAAGGPVLHAFWSQVTARALTLVGDATYAGEYGGVLELRDTSSILDRVHVEQGLAQYGGGIGVVNGSVHLTAVDLRENVATYRGGGMYASDAEVVWTGGSIRENVSNYGGGILLGGGTVASLYGLSVEGNLASSSGGGMRVEGGSPGRWDGTSIANSRFTDNSAQSGGGMAVSAASVQLLNVVIGSNYGGAGGGLLLESADNSTLEHVIIAGNDASSKGGVYITTELNPTIVIAHSIIAYNTGYNLYVYGNNVDFPGLTVKNSALFNPGDAPQTNRSSLDPSVFTGEPGFLTYDASGIPLDLHLALDSVLVDYVSGSSSDPDGSSTDLGIYGGDHGNEWDLDGDGFPDWFWPGTLSDAPAGFSPTDFDADDLDGTRH